VKLQQVSNSERIERGERIPGYFQGICLNRGTFRREIQITNIDRMIRMTGDKRERRNDRDISL
jgi:hypothetical protein